MLSPRRRLILTDDDDLILTDDLAPAGANTVTPSATTVPAPDVPSSHEKWRQAEKTGDPEESAKRIWNKQLIMIMAGPGEEEADNLPDSERYIFKMLESRDVWSAVKRWKSPVGMHELMWDCAAQYAALSGTLGDALKEALKHDSLADTPLREIVEREVERLDDFGSEMLALGFIRGIRSE